MLTKKLRFVNELNVNTYSEQHNVTINAEIVIVYCVVSFCVHDVYWCMLKGDCVILISRLHLTVRLLHCVCCLLFFSLIFHSPSSGSSFVLFFKQISSYETEPSSPYKFPISPHRSSSRTLTWCKTALCRWTKSQHWMQKVENTGKQNTKI